MYGLGPTHTFGLSQNWSGPKSTGTVDVNYNSHPLFTYEKWNFARRISRRRRRGKGADHPAWW